MSCLTFATSWTVGYQVPPLSMGFPRPEYWSGLPFLSPGDLSDPGIELVSLESPALAGRFFTTEPPGKPPRFHVPQLRSKNSPHSHHCMAFQASFILQTWVKHL